jgi:uncharacterized membrane protein
MRTVCECNHLTNFAALMNPEERNETLKSIFTYICCGVSAICLLFNLILLFIQNKNKLWTITDDLMKKRNKITFNLSVCLMIANLLIIFGMNKTDIEPKVQKYYEFCKSLAFEIISKYLNLSFSGCADYSLDYYSIHCYHRFFGCLLRAFTYSK